MLDIVLRNGMIFDGTGSMAFRGDIGISGDRIAVVSPTVQGRPKDRIFAEREIDVEGLAVAPGFIDIHSHDDLLPFFDPLCEAKIRQGVTSVVTGQCGLGVAPFFGDIAGFWPDYIAGIVGNTGKPWPWGSFGSYLEQVASQKPAVNFVSFVSHGAIRSNVLGEDDRVPELPEIKAMSRLLLDSLDEGAYGFSVGLGYLPGIFATRGELLELFRVAASRNVLVSVHMRSYNRRILHAMDEVFSLAREAGSRLQISHLKTFSAPDYGVPVEQIIEEFDRGLASGVDAAFDQQTYSSGSTLLSQIIPPSIKTHGLRGALDILSDPDQFRLIMELIESGNIDPNWDNPVGYAGWNKLMVCSVNSEANKKWETMTLDEIARELQTSPFEAAIKLISEENGMVGMVMFDVFSDSDVVQLLKHPQSTIGSDGLLAGKPHPRMFHAFPRIFRRFVRELKAIPIEEAIRQMTQASAERVGLRDRGVLEEGKYADITIFDPDKISDVESYVKPDTPPVGIKYVLVNGKLVIDEGRVTANRPGRILTREH